MSTPSAPILSIENAVKTFSITPRQPGFLGALRGLISPQRKLVTAVDGISFTATRGEAIGYLGPNGAGKSTMIKMLTGILQPTSGHLNVLGFHPQNQRRQLAARIGVVFGQRSQLWWDLPVADSLELHRRIYRVAPERFAATLKRFSDALDLAPLLPKPVRQLSLGQRMRVEIVMALLHEPELLFLDEPTIGLDVMAKDAIRDFLRTLTREHGVTLILTSHDLQDIELVCPRILLTHEGKLLHDGPLETLKQRLGSHRRLKLTFAADPGPLALGPAQIERDEGRIKHLRYDSATTSPVDVILPLRSRDDLVDIAIEEPDLDEVIRTFYRQHATQTPPPRKSSK